MIAPLTTTTIGLTKDLGAFGRGINGSYSSKHELTLGLQLFIAIGREPQRGAGIVDAQPLAATGAGAALRRARQWTQGRQSRHTARASIASPCPTGPIFSAVFAFTLT